MKSTKEIDDLIREALSGADASLWDELGEQSLPELVTETFLGKHRLLSLYSIVVGLLLLALCVYSVTRMVSVTEIRSVLLWFAAAGACMLGIFGLKVWSWLEMTRIATVREIKRLELQVARLAQRIDED